MVREERHRRCGRRDGELACLGRGRLLGGLRLFLPVRGKVIQEWLNRHCITKRWLY